MQATDRPTAGAGASSKQAYRSQATCRCSSCRRCMSNSSSREDAARCGSSWAFRVHARRWDGASAGVLSPCCGAGERALGSMKILDLPSRSLGLPSRRVEAGAARLVHDGARRGSREGNDHTASCKRPQANMRDGVCTSLGQRPARRWPREWPREWPRGWPRGGPGDGHPLSRLWALHGAPRAGVAQA